MPDNKITADPALATLNDDLDVFPIVDVSAVANKKVTVATLKNTFLANVDVNAKGDLYVGTANDTVGILSVGANGTVLTADSTTGTGVKWAAASGSSTLFPMRRSGYWSTSPFVSNITSRAFPIIDRAYLTPMWIDEATTITAAGIYMSAAGTAANLLRIGIYSSVGFVPTTILNQGTVAGDSIGDKTLTFGAAVSVGPGLYWVAVCPQGSSTPGSVHMADALNGFFASPDSDASWNGGNITGAGYPQALYFTNSGAFADSPALTAEVQSRIPAVAVRYS